MAETQLTDEAGRKPIFVSWSRLKDWESCHRKGFAKSRGVPRDKIDGRIFLPGTLADRAMRRFLEQEEGHEPGQMVSYLEDLWQEHAIDSEEYKIFWKGNKREDQERVRDLVRRVVTNLEPFLFKAVLPFEYQPELRLKVPLRIPDLHGKHRTIWLSGGMDIVVRRSPEDVRIYDLKATENPSYVTGDTKAQLTFYPVMWNLLAGTPFSQITTAFLVPALTPGYVPHAPSGDDIRHLMTRIVKYAHGIWEERNDTPTSDTPCWNCDMKGTCPKFHQPVRIDADGKMRVVI